MYYILSKCTNTQMSNDRYAMISFLVFPILSLTLFLVRCVLEFSKFFFCRFTFVSFTLTQSRYPCSSAMFSTSAKYIYENVECTQRLCAQHCKVYNKDCSTPEFGSGRYIATTNILFLFPFSRLAFLPTDGVPFAVLFFVVVGFLYGMSK